MIYKIPLYERYIEVIKSLYYKSKCVHIDKVGLFVYYNSDKELDPSFIRRHIALRRKTWCFVEANSPEDAVKTFFNEWEGAKIGGECEECKALWINREEYITEFPPCKLLHKNKKDEFICGEPSTDGAGEFGMCMLEGYDPPGFNCQLILFTSYSMN